LALLVLGAVVSSACGTSPPAARTTAAPTVELPGGALPFGTGLRAPTGQPWTFGSLMLCADKPTAPVRVTTVTLDQGSYGLKVVSFGTRPNPFLTNPPGESFGVARGTTITHHITGLAIYRCLPPSHGTIVGTASTELVISVERTGPGSGRAGGIEVHYTSGGATGTSSFPEQIGMCPPQRSAAPSCTP
jgi:hypothetical protein